MHSNAILALARTHGLVCGAVLTDEALTALEAKERELSQANAALEEKSADMDRLSIELQNQTECVSRLMAEVRISDELSPKSPMPAQSSVCLSDNQPNARSETSGKGGCHSHRQMGSMGALSVAGRGGRLDTDRAAAAHHANGGKGHGAGKDAGRPAERAQRQDCRAA